MEIMRFKLRDSSSPVLRNLHWFCFVAALPVGLIGIVGLVTLLNKWSELDLASYSVFSLLVLAVLGAAGAPIALWAALQARGPRVRLGSWVLVALPATLAITALPLAADLAFVLLPLGVLCLTALMSALQLRSVDRSLVVGSVLSVFLTVGCVFGVEWGHAEFVRVVEQGNLRAASFLLVVGIGPERAEEEEPWPLLIAVERFDLAMVRLLVRAGATPYDGTRSEVSPMVRSIELEFSAATLVFLAAETAKVVDDAEIEVGPGDEVTRVATL